MNNLQLIMLDDDLVEIDVTEATPADVEIASADVLEEATDASVDINTSDDLAEAIQTMEDLRSNLALVSTEGNSLAKSALVAAQLDSIARRTGISINGFTKESLTTESAFREENVYVTESLAVSIIKAWQHAILVLKRIVAGIATFYAKLFMGAGKIKTRADELAKNLGDSSKYKATADENGSTVTIDAKWLSVGKSFNPKEAISEAKTSYDTAATEVLDSLKTLSAVFKKITVGTEVNELNAHVKEVEVSNSQSFGKLNNKNLAGHTSRTVNGTVVYTLVKADFKNEVKTLSSSEAASLAKEVFVLADALSKKDDTSKVLKRTLEEETKKIEEIAKELEKTGSDASASKYLIALNKISAKKNKATLDNVSTLAFRVAHQGLRYVEASAKKLAINL